MKPHVLKCAWCGRRTQLFTFVAGWPNCGRSHIRLHHPKPRAEEK